MRKNANRATENKVADTTVEGTDAQAAATFDNATDAAQGFDPFRAEFVVEAATVANSPAKARFGDTMSFVVIRHRKGAYEASYTVAPTDEKPEGETVTGKIGSRKPDVAIRSVIKALGAREQEVMFDAFAAEAAQAPMPEAAGDNSAPDTWFFDEESEIASRLETIAGQIRDADVTLASADRNTRAGWLGFGRARNAALAIFREAGLVVDGGDGETAKRGKAAWGTWLRTRFAGSENVNSILASKNASAQAGFFAEAPDDVIDAVGTNSAATFMGKAEKAAAEIAGAVAESALAQRRAEDDADLTLTGEQARLATLAVLSARESAYAAAFDKWQKEAGKAAEKGKATEPFADAKKNGPLRLVRWLYDVAAASGDFATSKLGKAVAKAWETETTKPSAEETEEREAERATKAIAKRFADMATDAAAQHLLHILVAHEAPEQVLAVLGDMLVDWNVEQAEKAAAAQAAGEKDAENNG